MAFEPRSSSFLLFSSGVCGERERKRELDLVTHPHRSSSVVWYSNMWARRGVDLWYRWSWREGERALVMIEMCTYTSWRYRVWQITCRRRHTPTFDTKLIQTIDNKLFRDIMATIWIITHPLSLHTTFNREIETIVPINIDDGRRVMKRVCKQEQLYISAEITNGSHMLLFF